VRRRMEPNQRPCHNHMVIPDGAKRQSGIHTPGLYVTETQGLWIPGSTLRVAPE
jgi:hypothetical protein